MKIPNFIPLNAKERNKRAYLGVALEALIWSYIFVILGRVVAAGIILPQLENLAFNEEPTLWAQKIVEWSGLNTQDLDFPWHILGVLFSVGTAVGLAIGMTGRGMGHWLACLSKVRSHNAEDSFKAHQYWAFARKESIFVLVMTIVAGWVITRVDFGAMFYGQGLISAGRLFLQLTCGVPGIALHKINLGFVNFELPTSFFEILQWLLNRLVIGLNSILRLVNQAPLPLYEMTCVPSDTHYISTAVSKLVESVYLAFMATFFSAPLAFLLSFFAARNLTRYNFTTRSIYNIIRMYINVTRSIEPVIWAVLFSVWVGIGPFAGSLALMIHSMSSLIKQYSEAVENVDEGPVEALRATGANEVATVWYAVVPQIVLPYLAFTIYRWDMNLRMATVIGLVGGGGIGSMLIQAQGIAAWPQVGTLAFLVFLVVWAMDFLSARIRSAIQ